MSSIQSCFLASDLGSSGCKTVLIAADGRVLGRTEREYSTYYPRPGWAEQDPEQWYAAFCATTREVLAKVDVSAGAIAAVGLDGITHTAVLLDDADAVLPPVLHMFDTRSQAYAQRLQAQWGARFGDECLNGCTSLWTYPQLLWIRENCPDTWRRTRHVLFPKDYVRHRIAPGYVTDYVEADGTLLFDPVRRRWIEDFVADVGLVPEVWPRVAAPTEIVARISPEGAGATGLLAGTPCIAGTSDTAAEMLGCGAVQPGDAVVKLASVGRLAFITRTAVWRTGLITYPHVLDGLWYPGTACKHAGSAYRWLRDLLWHDAERPAGAFAELDAGAAEVPAGSDGLVFVPHLSGAWSPHWDDAREAAFCGVRAGHTRAHFARAVLEGVAFSIGAAWRGLENAGIMAQGIRLIGQGARSQVWREIVSNVLGRPLVVPLQTDAVFGTALLAAVGAGTMSPAAAATLSRDAIAATVAPRDELMNAYRGAKARFTGFEASLDPR